VSINESPPNRKPTSSPHVRLLARLYPLPKPLLTIEEWQRSRHLDLATYSRDDLELEAHRVRHRLAYDHRPHPWLLERRERVRMALRRAR
jgi:hypothetical protein